MISLADLQRRIDTGDLSPDAAIAHSLEAIAAHEKAIGAFVCRADKPRAATSGALRGIAVGIKDIIDTAEFPTEMGSPIYKANRPRADAPVVMALKRAGATIVGKTTTTAFAANDPTATLNPHNHGHTPGGSSAGSAAAVGAGMIPLALGTQTGGSVIRPASFCGAAAIKPSYRLLPTVGVKCFSWTLDTVGLFAAGVTDLALGLSAMTGRPELMLPASLPTPRIGVVTQEFAGAPEKEGAEALQVAARLPSAPAPRCARFRCPTSSRKPGASTRSCRISRRTSPSPGNIARIVVPGNIADAAEVDDVGGGIPALDAAAITAVDQRIVLVAEAEIQRELAVDLPAVAEIKPCCHSRVFIS